ncbi:MAG: phasin family protein [Arenicellales bacterium]|jgi:hypothetical protein|nr:hypothetical protein [Acidiferrobacteraceae bacterium]MDP6123214.1 phasin family protein [Arenicellales bacterium]MDP6290251.1 phasin family protein [Arenicellales bacterium]MDP6435313.1 phasin family protein [Arenicellales bacterium]MDP6673114.1 phasin family protein [Arenicellales bacterium]|tara:strand:- start:711 stop:1124 length:414 start_codon:yes stop_codon:yes gene_type:complete
MKNDTVNLYTEIAEKSVATIKSVGQLNLRTFEALAAKQVEIVQNAADTGAQQSAILTDIKDINKAYSAQTELATSFADQLAKNVNEIADIFKVAQEEFNGLADEVVADAKVNAEKVTAISKNEIEKAVKAAKDKKVA